jgi:hypothetical protein
MEEGSTPEANGGSMHEGHDEMNGSFESMTFHVGGK